MIRFFEEYMGSYNPFEDRGCDEQRILRAIFQQGDTNSRQQVQDAHCALAFVLRIGGGDDTHGAFAFRVLSLFLRVGAFDVLQQQVGDPLRLRGFVRQAHFIDLRRAFLVLSALAVHPDG